MENIVQIIVAIGGTTGIIRLLDYFFKREELLKKQAISTLTEQIDRLEHRVFDLERQLSVFNEEILRLTSENASLLTEKTCVK
ncbi:MAG: hypothetical protein LBM95_08775 [Lactobacillales bacterium]|jgi:chaperonin cofactor prefoldin|nr:hypothetical protein [Lactobacillales bacterium]